MFTYNTAGNASCIDVWTGRFHFLSFFNGAMTERFRIRSLPKRPMLDFMPQFLQIASMFHALMDTWSHNLSGLSFIFTLELL